MAEPVTLDVMNVETALKPSLSLRPLASIKKRPEEDPIYVLGIEDHAPVVGKSHARYSCSSLLDSSLMTASLN